jgi:outer membrane lipoprotein SlyB
VTVDVGEIKIIRIVKKSKAGLGFLAGAILGVILGCSAGDDPSGFYTITAEYKAFISAILLGILGMTCGISLGQDKTIKLEDKYDSEIKEILEDLRKKARVPNFQ